MVIQLLYFFLIMSAFLPMIRQRQLAMARLRLIRKIEKRRKSRLITLIHRQECVSFLGVPFRQYIDIEDSELILRAIRRTPDDMPIDILLHTPGGLVLAAEQIAHAIRRHPAPVTVLVPHYAMSGALCSPWPPMKLSWMKTPSWVPSTPARLVAGGFNSQSS